MKADIHFINYVDHEVIMGLISNTSRLTWYAYFMLLFIRLIANI